MEGGRTLSKLKTEDWLAETELAELKIDPRTNHVA